MGGTEPLANYGHRYYRFYIDFMFEESLKLFKHFIQHFLTKNHVQTTAQTVKHCHQTFFPIMFEEKCWMVCARLKMITKLFYLDKVSLYMLSLAL